MAEQEKKSKFKLTRGQFFGVAWLGAMGLVTAETVFALGRYIQPVSTGGFGGWILAGNVDDFEVDSVTYILSGRFYIVRNDLGLLAIWQKCTHLGCAVPYDQGTGQFVCPCHGSAFTADGDVLNAPAPRPLDLFSLSISEDGEILVDTGKAIERDHTDPAVVVYA